MTALLLALALCAAGAAPALAAGSGGGGGVPGAPPPSTAMRTLAAEGQSCTNPAAYCAADHTFTVDYTTTGSPDCRYAGYIEWGDGTSEEVTFGAGGTSVTHRYEAPGQYQAHDSGIGYADDDDTTCTYHPFSRLVQVPGDHYRIEVKSWIPQASVVDPYHPVAYPVATQDFTAECGRVAGVTNVRSSFAGDGHVGYDGGVRVAKTLDFDWDGTKIVSPQPAPGRIGTTVRTWRYSVPGRPDQTCRHSATAADTTAASGTGTTARVNYSVSNPLVRLGLYGTPLPSRPAPPIVADVSATLDGTTMTVRFTASNFPSQGFAVYRNGRLLRQEVVNNPSCLPVAGPVGSVVLAGALSTQRTTTRQFSTEAPSGTVVARCGL